ncbi:hypothetical protein ACFR9U_10775 [Halorientalis brevis]|uniref:Flagellin n=1 Tax=Halorientalis brevis TaxID=1126241 RepID=A0ABD6CD24_9EURY|nr:hypothetical protein [Halorientalis brevis]
MVDKNRVSGAHESETADQVPASWRDERGLSDLVGFVLAFFVILASVGFVSTFGVDVLEDVRNSQQENNAEQAFNVMAKNFDEIEQAQAPSRTAEIDLRDGDLSVRNTTKVTIEVTHDNTGSFETAVYPRQIRLQPNPTDSTVLLYENGATIRGTNRTSQGIVDNPPTMSCSEDQAIVSIVQLNTSTDRQLGSGTVRITGSENRTSLVYPVNRTGQNSSTNVTDLHLSFESEFNTAWVSYLTKSSDDGWEKVSDTEVRCHDIERVFVRETEINVQFVR